MALSNTQIPKPKDWQDFERKMRVLVACVLDDPRAQQNGRSGQRQNGVDIFGTRTVGHLVGVQCKKKLDKHVTEKELRAEVNEAKKFKPKLAEFVLATTAARDEKIQTTARLITEELASTECPMVVTVWGWDDIEEHVSRHVETIKAFDPTWTPLLEKGLTRIEVQLRQILEQTKVQQPSSLPADVAADPANENTPLHGKITAFIALIDDGHPTAALEQLEKIRTNDWAGASRSERYRLLVAIGAAKFKQGDQGAAGAQLLAAFQEYPEHKKAKQNRAKGLLLVDDYAKAIEVALDALKSDSANTDAASTLIQARIHDSGVENPLDDIPAALWETEDVLIARIHFLRCKDDKAWVPLARRFAKNHPSSRFLKTFGAEAVLDELTRSDRDVIAGAPAKSVSQEELQASVKTLQDTALDAIKKGYALSPSIANNAALALRLVDDIQGAVHILDAALAQHPDDETLGFQRAVLAFAQNDMRKVLELLPENPAHPEGVPMRATALADTGRPDEALAVIDDFDASAVTDLVKVGLLSARCHAYLVRKDKPLALETARKAALGSPGDPHVAAVLIRTLYLSGETDAASKALDDAVRRFDDTTTLSTRMLLSFEAQRLDRDDIIVSLLKDRVEMTHESEALRLLVAASINGRFWVTAQATLASLAEPVAQEEWAQRAKTILAINTGNPNADQMVGAYLKRWPSDASMILVRIGFWQRMGRNADIEAFVKKIDFAGLKGRVETKMRIAAMAVRHGHAAHGLDYAYGLLMDNWDVPKAHMVYQGMILLNEHIAPVMPQSELVAENTVVVLATDESKTRYRIEKRAHRFFEDERLHPDDDLALLLAGKRVGDTFALQDRVGAKPVTIKAIKPVYVDAFQRSVDGFNERFPHSGGMFKFSFDVTADDPLEEMRTITKDFAESNLSLLEQYRSNGLPLAFVASVMGRDPIDAWTGLRGVDVQFRACRGSRDERDEALHLITTRERKGCVLDAITLSVIRRLNVSDAVAAVCGPLHAPQSVLDLTATRALEAKHNIRNTVGVMAWRDGQLVMHEFTEEMLESAAAEAEAERAWAMENIAVVTAMPKQDFPPETRSVMEIMGHVASDPMVAADGSGMLLLSDDLGLRVWSTLSLGISSTWLQPVLMVARQEGHLSGERYFEAINTLALSGHSYTSLEPGALLHQACKDGLELTDNLRRLIDLVGGPNADLSTNCDVAAEFIDLVIREAKQYFDDFRITRISSQILDAMTKGRENTQQEIVRLVVERTTARRGWLERQALAWLVGHSIGLPEFDDLLALHKKYPA